MNGADHFREAERLARQALPIQDPACALVLAQLATAHATLATAPERAPEVVGAAAELAALRRAVAELLHDVDTRPDSEVQAALESFRAGLPDTAHGEPVLVLVDALMRAEGDEPA